VECTAQGGFYFKAAAYFDRNFLKEYVLINHADTPVRSGCDEQVKYFVTMVIFTKYFNSNY
jgi:hypothetical protein